MQLLDLLPEPIKAVHLSLEPFIRQRQEIEQIRRVLALHLSSHLNPEDRLPLSKPLCLMESGQSIPPSSGGVRGIRKDYIRCARANMKAQEEYQKVRSEHRQIQDCRRVKGGINNKDEEISGISLALFLGLVKDRRKHERLCVLQDYVEILAQKPAAAADHFDPSVVPKDVQSLPTVPPDVMVSAAQRQQSYRRDLNELVEQLEKSVLRAKLLLTKEQKLLSGLPEVQARNGPPTRSWSRLQALAKARNELINWIEDVLAMAGEGFDDLERELVPQSTEKMEKSYVNNHLGTIQRQYAQYNKVRQSLIIAATRPIDKPIIKPPEDGRATLETKNEVEDLSPMSHVLQPYLGELASLLSQQKSMIQQKCHVTISLAKQLKEASQGLDRLADESHLLQASLQHKGLKSSPSEEEIASHEKPDSSHRARPWVHASEAAGKTTKEAVAEKLQNGIGAISNARQTLSDLRVLLGEDVNAGAEYSNQSKDIWAALDGDLGVITRDGVES